MIYAGKILLILAIGSVWQVQTVKPNGCGLYCAYIALNALSDGSVETIVDFEVFEKELGKVPDAGSSIAELQSVLELRGCYTLATRTSLAALRRRNEPFVGILLVQDSHFVVLRSLDQDKVRIVDYPKSYSLTDKELNDRWDGTSLLVSKIPLHDDVGQAIWFVTKWILLGGGLLGAIWFGKRFLSGSTR